MTSQNVVVGRSRGRGQIRRGPVNKLLGKVKDDIYEGRNKSHREDLSVEVLTSTGRVSDDTGAVDLRGPCVLLPDLYS